MLNQKSGTSSKFSFAKGIKGVSWKLAELEPF